MDQSTLLDSSRRNARQPFARVTHMSITPQELGERLRVARETAGLSQELAAARLEIPRAALSLVEHGRRSVTGLELDQLAYLYSRDIRDFLAEDFAAHDVITAHFRVMPQQGDTHEREALRKRIALWRAISNLEPTPPPVAGTSWPDASARRVLVLALEAVRRSVISTAKLAEIARLVDLPPHEVDDLVALAGLDDEPLEVLPLPRRI